MRSSASNRRRWSFAVIGRASCANSVPLGCIRRSKAGVDRAFLIGPLTTCRSSAYLIANSTVSGHRPLDGHARRTSVVPARTIPSSVRVFGAPAVAYRKRTLRRISPITSAHAAARASNGSRARTRVRRILDAASCRRRCYAFALHKRRHAVRSRHALASAVATRAYAATHSVRSARSGSEPGT